MTLCNLWRLSAVVVVYLFNGVTVRLPSAVDVRPSTFLDDGTGEPVTKGLVCRDKDEKPVAEFKVDDVSGYTLTRTARAVHHDGAAVTARRR